MPTKAELIEENKRLKAEVAKLKAEAVHLKSWPNPVTSIVEAA